MAQSWISRSPDRCGGSACIRDTRHTVWGLVEWKRSGRSDDWILSTFPDLTRSDLILAWEYAHEHPREIEIDLWQNAACMVEYDPGRPPLEQIREGVALGLSDEQILEAFDPPLSPAVLADIRLGERVRVGRKE